MSREPRFEQEPKRYFKPGGRVIIITLLVLMSLLFVLFWVRKNRKPERLTVLEINGTPVYINEAMIYYQMMREAFEAKGGEDIWTLDILGIDAEQTALDQTLTSIVRVKTARNAMQEPTQDDKIRIEAAAAAIRDHLSQEYRLRHEIDDNLIYQVAEDNYLAYQYEHNARFLYTEIEDDIQAGMAQRFGKYDNTKTMNDYLERVILDPIMFYTGTFVEDRWTSYPEVQREQILTKAEAVLSALTADNFRFMANQFADSTEVTGNPVFQQGEVICPEERFGQIYKGQIDASVAEQIFSLSIGEISPIMETPYGYLIVRVSGFRSPLDQDRTTFEQQLAQARTRYRLALTEELKERRLSQELDHLVEESTVIKYEELFAEYVRTGE